MKKKFKSTPELIIMFISCICIILYFYITDIRFSRESALKALALQKKGKFKILEIVKTGDTEMLVFKNLDTGFYGCAKLDNHRDILFRATMINVHLTSRTSEPFITAEMREKDSYLIFVVSEDPRVKYISIGTEIIKLTSDSQVLNITFSQVISKPNIYEVKELQDEYVVFKGMLKGTSRLDIIYEFHNKAIVMGFDKDGKFIADRRGIYLK